MKRTLVRTKPVDFEDLGFHIGLEENDLELAKTRCALTIDTYAKGLEPEIARLGTEIGHKRCQHEALRAALYDRPVPVNDARMLSHEKRLKLVFILVVLAAVASLVGNFTTFHFYGLSILVSIASAMGLTALSVVVGHYAYETLLAGNRRLQVIFIVAVFGLFCAGIFDLARARQYMVDRAAAETSSPSSYVDDSGVDSSSGPAPAPQESSESNIHHAMGQASILMMIAADLMLGYLVGKFMEMRNDDDFTAWVELHDLAEVVRALEKEIADHLASIEIAKRQSMAGILRALNLKTRRRPPYHPALTLVVLSTLLIALPCRAQTVDHEEGILLDASTSVGKGAATSELFDHYLIGARTLLLTEPTNTRVWVLGISADSFGSDQAILKGWTPDARGVFTDDLNRARHELAARFVSKTSGMAPAASGTDIIGGLWRMKAFFESSEARHNSKTIWIFSDMVNETQAFALPTLLHLGPERMLERAKANGLVVPLNGYRIYVYGASPQGLTPERWMAIKNFWTAYFAAAGAELVSYSPECDVRRSD